MSAVKMATILVAFAFLMFLAPASVQAQDQRFRVSFAPAAATVGGDAELALEGSFGYRFSEHFWFEGDLTWLDAAAGGVRDRDYAFDARSLNTSGLLELVRDRTGVFGRGRLPGLPAIPALPNLPISVGPLRASTDGSTIVGTLGLRYELPVQTERFRPYAAGGLGINNTRQEFTIEATTITPAIDESNSHTGYAFNAGAGASIRLVGQFWANVDARYFRLSRDRDIMRLGGGASFRF
jgi:opacity protein-like surface antigen